MAVGDLERVNVNAGALTASAATIYAVPTSRRVVHMELNLCNTDASTEYLPDVYFVPSGSVAGVSNQVIKGVASKTGLQAGETQLFTWNQFLTQGQLVQANANSASKITHKLSVVLEVV